MFIILLLCVSGALSLHRDLSSDRRFINATENIKLQENCGYFSARQQFKSLYGASEEINNVPWVVSIMRNSEDWYPQMSEYYRQLSMSLQCSGALISPRHVITAAHCFGIQKIMCEGDPTFVVHNRNLERFRVYLGGTCSDPKTCARNRRDDDLVGREIVRVYIPRNQGGNGCRRGDEGDIAVIELDEDVHFSKKVNPVCLPKFQDLHKSSEFRISAFGNDPAQKRAFGSQIGLLKTTIESASDCHDYNANLIGLDTTCSISEFTTACGGDSGGAVVQTLPKGGAKPFLAAVVKGGVDCQQTHKELKRGQHHVFSSILTNLTWHLNWICSVTGVCPDAENKFYDDVDHTKQVYELRRLAKDEIYAP